jgi:RND family efflux transporter MFP subunit
MSRTSPVYRSPLTRAAALAVLAIFAHGCGGGAHDTAADRQEAPVAVDTIAAAMHEGPESIEAGGSIRGRTSATLASRIMAPVRAVLVQPGDRVTAGQALVILDDRDVSAAARQARAHATAAARGLDASRTEQQAADAALALAKVTHARIAALYQRKSATAQEFDQAVAGLRAAETRVTRAAASAAEADANLEGARAGGDAADVAASFTRIVAPFAGLVTEKLVEPGTLVTAGTPLLRLEDTTSFKLDVRLDESRTAWVAPDTPVRVVVDGPQKDRDVQGRIFEIGRAMEADSRAFLVTIALPASETLRSGMFARAYLPGPSRRALRVPDSALVRRGQLTNVFVADAGTARLRLVSIGRSSAAHTDVLAGLSEGELIVVAPPPGLRDGARLAPRRPVAATAGGGRS